MKLKVVIRIDCAGYLQSIVQVVVFAASIRQDAVQGLCDQSNERLL